MKRTCSIAQDCSAAPGAGSKKKNAAQFNEHAGQYCPPSVKLEAIFSLAATQNNTGIHSSQQP